MDKNQITGLQEDNQYLREELKKLRHVEKDMELNASLLHAIHNAQSMFVDNHSIKDIFDNLLTNLLELTGSEYGFIGEVLYDSENSPYLRTYAITNISWSADTQKFYDENAPTGFEFSKLQSLFGEVMTTKKVVLSNQPSEDSRRGGLPEGHPSLDSFLGLPFFSGETLNGMVGIANRPTGYDTQIVEYLQPFLFTCANIIKAVHVDYERVQLDRELALQDERYRTLVQHSPYCIHEIDLAGQFISMNPAGMKMIGVADIGQVCAMPYLDTVSDPDRERISDLLVGALTGKASEFEFQAKNGHKLQATFVPISDDRGEVERLMGITLDITDRFELNKQLRRSQKMEAVGQLTGGIAHDFNNILAIIMGNLELVQHEASGDIRILAGVDRALKGAARGTVLIDKLLGFSREHTNETSPTSVNQLVENMDDLLVKSLTVSIEIETQLDAKLWSVNVDKGDMEGAILNLALNARDAMPEGGRLIIETANKLLDADFVRSQPEAKIGEYAMLSVSDTGIGMLPEVSEKVLEPFFTTKSEGQGTGLGLSMVYGFVKRSGGFITIVSEPGAGTSIKLFLPRGRKAEQVDILTTEKVELPRGDETVLVVDDEEELTKLAVANLEHLGYKVLTAFDGKSALALIKDNPNIDLLFSDVIMPGELDGYLLSIAAKKARPALRILLTSGFTKRNEDDPGADSPVFEELTRSLLRKPYNQAGLAWAIRDALDGMSTSGRKRMV